VDGLERLDASRPDAGVRLVSESGHPETTQWLFDLWGSINRKVPAWGSLLARWHTWYPCEPKQTSPTHLYPWFSIKVRLRVISSAFAWVIASSGTWGSFELWDSCYSWWLPPPIRLEAAEALWQELVIVLGHLPVIMRGSCAFLGGAPKATLVDYACHWATSLVGRFLRCPSKWMRFVQHLLAAEPPSVGWHNRA
jgi:hypothetical protein